MRFFQGYNDEAMEMWQKFKQYLDQIVTEDSHEEAQRAATETFVKFKNWIEQHDSNQL
jgi:heme oxygenase